MEIKIDIECWIRYMHYFNDRRQQINSILNITFGWITCIKIISGIIVCSRQSYRFNALLIPCTWPAFTQTFYLFFFAVGIYSQTKWSMLITIRTCPVTLKEIFDCKKDVFILLLILSILNHLTWNLQKIHRRFLSHWYQQCCFVVDIMFEEAIVEDIFWVECCAKKGFKNDMGIVPKSSKIRPLL